MTDKKPAFDAKRMLRVLDPVPSLCGNMIGTNDGRYFACKRDRGHIGPHLDGPVGWANREEPP